MDKKSIIPPTGEFGSNWINKFNLTQGPSGEISAAGWTYKNEGFIQQTFLGASIRNFNIVAGFGDTVSSLSVDLVNDEYNTSDGLSLGVGDDVYHNGERDLFTPPPVGTPVFFKFGKNFATVEQAWRKTFDDIYNENTLRVNPKKITRVFDNLESGIYKDYYYLDLEETDKQAEKYTFIDQSEFYDIKTRNQFSRGRNHFTFGGILQSYTQSGGAGGNPLYNVQVVDPREILSNTVVILSNYTGSIFNNKNYFNVYGFLEYDISDDLKSQFLLKNKPGFNLGPIESDATWSTENPDIFPFIPPTKTNNLLEKVVDKSTGRTYYFGNDMYRFGSSEFNFGVEPPFFPITGQGLSRRCDQGIPWYRVRQALDTLFNYNGFLPKEYVDKGFGGPINFRGFNYVVDFTGIPIEKIPQMYFLDFDQIDLLSLAQELCEVISHDLFISLLPVIDHPASEFLYNYNKYKIEQGKSSEIIAGIIRIDAIDRSKAPDIGAIKSYLNDLESSGIHVESKDLGYELSNVTTDKIVAGAQEVEMYYFNTNRDRDNLQLRLLKNGLPNHYEFLQEHQWLLETSLQQQILPFYGFLGKDAVTIPRGFGSYQQIMLDSSKLDAHGVGNYYIATEMELRAAVISYERWSSFLTSYNETFIEELTENYVFWKQLAASTPENSAVDNIFNADALYNREFGISVPRCVFISDRNYMGSDGYPANPCAPPYGYPLYYKRAEKIGIAKAGISKFITGTTSCITNIANILEKSKERDEILKVAGDSIKKYNESKKQFLKDNYLSPEERKNLNTQFEYIKTIQDDLQKFSELEPKIAILKDLLAKAAILKKQLNRMALANEKNAKKVYEFIKSVADKHLGKTFLVKIPKACNVNYSKEISLYKDNSSNILSGPFGFQPQPITSKIGEFSINTPQGLFASEILLQPYRNNISSNELFTPYLRNKKINQSSIEEYTYGALKGNFNPISDAWEFNYKPEPQGGFFNFAIYDRNLSLSQSREIADTKLPFAQLNLLAPMDLTNFVEDNGRISCYVRYDHSEHLDFGSIGSDSISQQILTSRGFIPDVMEELNNTNPSKLETFDIIQRRIENNEFVKPASVAFVKCDVDEKLYMAPKSFKQITPVYGRTYEWQKSIQPLGFVEKEITERDYNNNYFGYASKYPNACCRNGLCKILVPSQPYAELIFSPGQNGGSDGASANILDFARYYDSSLDANIIVTDDENLDSDHVYAIITIPGQVVPSVDSRFLDGPYQSTNTPDIKHILTQDVVRMPAGYGFEKPAPIVNAKKALDCDRFSFKQLTDAQKAQQEVVSRKLDFANPEINIGYFQPSPVYPDLVALPLMSKERCYGPWVSSSIVNGKDERVRYSDVGGKVEFVKDENLAPWNYAGYQLMNEAGSLQAQFSNSLLLFSERGGFVIPDAPTGISIAKALNDSGPLVTSISVDISDSVKTTVRMDLYTSRFGKLQKHKEEAISKIVRERQKIIDQNNSMIKKGLGKSASSSNLLGAINPLGNQIEALSKWSSQYLTSLETGNTVQDKIVATVSKVETNTKNMITDEDLVTNRYVNNTSIQSKNYLEEVMGLAEDENTLNKVAYQSAGDYLSNVFTPYTNDVHNHYMPSKPYFNKNAINKRMS